MNRGVLHLMKNSPVPIITPKMTATSQTENGLTFTCDIAGAYNIDVGTYTASTGPVDLGWLYFPVPMVVSNIHNGANHMAWQYVVAGMTVTLYYDSELRHTQTLNPAVGAQDFAVSNIIVNKAHIQITDGSDWQKGGGGLGATNGINISGLALL